jgi:hypothetical protein
MSLSLWYRKIDIMDKLMIFNRPDLNVLDYMHDANNEIYRHGKGTYRVIAKCQAGFMVSSDIEAESPIEVFRRYKAKAIQSIAYVTIYGTNYTVYARNGKKIWASKEFLSEITVGDINQELHNTALYNATQYAIVEAKTWGDKAYVLNSEKSLEKVS